MTPPTGEPFVEVLRGDLVESVHRVAACASDDHGSVRFSLGDIDTPIFLRSTAKPFIAAAVIAAGAREHFELTPAEIAVVAASHTGEAFHVAAVRSILEKIGLNESALQCGAHLPYNEKAAQALLRSGTPPSALHNNCSGKHAGILALAQIIGADPGTYLALENPAQQTILNFCARMSDDDPTTWPLGVDGCGIPVYATSLRRAALAFARFATLEGVSAADAAALRIVRDAMIAHPEFISGTGEFDTELMRVGAGAVASKSGAEGVHGVAAIDAGIGYASKVIDGSSRARAPATLEVLHRLGILDASAMSNLAAFAHPIVYNRAGRKVGSIRTLGATTNLRHRNSEEENT